MHQATKISIVLLALSLLALTGAFTQRSQLARLNLQRKHLLEVPADPIDGKPGSAATPDELAISSDPTELLRLRNQVGQLRTRLRELEKELPENLALRAELSKRGTNAYVRKSEALMAGYASPADTIQTFLWAVHHRDVPTLLQCFTPEAAPMMKKMTEVGNFFAEADALVGIRILSQEPLPDGSIRVSGQVGPDTPPIELRLEKREGQWKFAAAP